MTVDQTPARQRLVRARPRRHGHRRLAHPGDAGARGPGQRTLRQLPPDRRRPARARRRRPARPAGLGRAAGLRRAEHHPPVQAGRRAPARRPLRAGGRPRSGQHRGVHRGGSPRAATPTGPASPAPSSAPCPGPRPIARSSWGRAGPASRSATACSGRGPSTSPCTTSIPAGPTTAWCAWPSASARTGSPSCVTSEDALAEAGGVVNATPHGHARPPRLRRAHRPAASRTSGSPTSSTSRSRPSCSPAARARGCRRHARRRDGGRAGRRCLRAVHRAGARQRADAPALRGAHRLMRKGIATVSLSGVLADKLTAIAARGVRRHRGLRQRPRRLAAVTRRGGPPVPRPRPGDRPLPARPRRRGRRPGALRRGAAPGADEARRDGRARRHARSWSARTRPRRPTTTATSPPSSCTPSVGSRPSTA